MSALEMTSEWPVDHVSAAVVGLDGAVRTVGDRDRPYRLASIAKPITAWATLVAVEEGIVSLDQPLGQPGCTIRHLLAHAGGYAFDGDTPIARPGTRRSYSNTGIEMVADAVAQAAGISFGQYLAEAVFEPLGMSRTELRGSPAHGIWSTLDDVVAFARDTMSSRLLSPGSVSAATTPVLPELAGIIPGIGRFDPCPWGLGFEVRGSKRPHWTGTRNSSVTFGHFGGAGTFVWVDPGVTGARGAAGALACVALTDRTFDEWAADALRLWPELSDAVIAEELSSAATRGDDTSGGETSGEVAG